jgi:hypothetical protein
MPCAGVASRLESGIHFRDTAKVHYPIPDARGVRPRLLYRMSNLVLSPARHLAAMVVAMMLSVRVRNATYERLEGCQCQGHESLSSDLWALFMSRG